MKRHRIVLLCLSLLFPTSLCAEVSAVDISLHVDSLRITHVSLERIEAEIMLSAKADRNARIERVDFSDIHASGVPFFAQPIDAPLEVHRGESLQLPPVSVTVYTADLDTLEPLIAIVDERQTRLHAQLTVRVGATPLEHLFLRSADPLAVVTIDQPVEVTPPGGLLGRVSARTLLQVAQVALGGADRLQLRTARGEAAWGGQLETARTALLRVHTCYTTGQKKAQSEVCVDGLAGSVGHQRAISAAELGTPWRFDPVLARAFADQGGRLRGGDARTTLEALVSTASGDISAGSAKTAMQATFQQVGDPVVLKEIVLPGIFPLSILSRSSPGVYGRLSLDAAGEGAGFRIAPDAVLREANWDELAVFRLVHAEDGTWRARVVLLSGSANGQAITFDRPVDRSTVGSPILTPQGLIGVVQSEAGGTLVAERPLR